MIDYKRDELFCDVRKNKILSAVPVLSEKIIREWFFYQKERTNIYYKKEVLKLGPPWTGDLILQNYKFVNTKRTLDRETKWLLRNIVNNTKLSYSNKLLNCILFRVINKGETLDLIGGAIDFSNLTLGKINNEIRQILLKKKSESPKYVFFGAAYILGGPKVNFGKFIEEKESKKEPNMVLRMIKYVYYNQEKLIKGVINAKNQLNVCEHLSRFKGIGKFLSYQMFIDMTYIKQFPFTEHNFVVAGPGCERGINWLFLDRDEMTSEECLFWFTINQFKIAKQYNIKWDIDKMFHFLPKSERIYTIMDMENSGTCELDKRCRTLFSNKHPKQRYRLNSCSR